MVVLSLGSGLHDNVLTTSPGLSDNAKGRLFCSFDIK
jgi:hypothetical protein